MPPKRRLFVGKKLPSSAPSLFCHGSSSRHSLQYDWYVLTKITGNPRLPPRPSYDWRGARPIILEYISNQLQSPDSPRQSDIKAMGLRSY